MCALLQTLRCQRIKIQRHLLNHENNTDILLCTSSKNLLGISLQARVAIKTWKTAFFTPKRMIKTWKSVVLFSYIFNDDSNTPKTELP